MTLSLSPDIDPEARKDILELHTNITRFYEGKWDAEKFRAYRLARGVYGQRQDGVNMIRIKLPFGRLTPDQLTRIADISDQFSNGNLHATTRQDIQLHYVKLSDAPQLWALLEEKGITLREACGNTIRNLTASYLAGIDPLEPFDVSPYANAMFHYFLRNPICQELGRKFKIAFSSSDQDEALTYIHDLGFIPKTRKVNDKLQLGFKVVLAGGLGAQPFLAQPVLDFLEEEQIIPFTEAVIRIFDRYGERVKRHKARLKYLVQELGLERFLSLIAEERLALRYPSFLIDTNDFPKANLPVFKTSGFTNIENKEKYDKWLTLNVFEQKQKGFYGVKVRVPLGNLASTTARLFALVAHKYASDDIRVTVNQGFLLKYVSAAALPFLFEELDALALAELGFGSIMDITACPGTDTCNLGIASSTGLAKELEQVIEREFPDLVYSHDIKIKISGCMNACGHHTIANIGFHGMSLKVGDYVLPAMQVLLGGGSLGNGEGQLAEKVIKLPSKKIPSALRLLLHDYQANSLQGEQFNHYYKRAGKNYFYLLLKQLSTIEDITQDLLLDWGNHEQYQALIGIGECAGALVDMVAIVLEEIKEKYAKAMECLLREDWVSAIYYAYGMLIHCGKALLLSQDLPCNSQYSVIANVEKLFSETRTGYPTGDFKRKVLQINQNTPSKEFAENYLHEAHAFFQEILETRANTHFPIIAPPV